jgi:hypothetical protein
MASLDVSEYLVGSLSGFRSSSAGPSCGSQLATTVKEERPMATGSRFGDRSSEFGVGRAGSAFVVGV